MNGPAGPLVFVDACVLFPPLVRRIVLGAAGAGLLRPCWSDRVLDEWQIAVARRHGAAAEDQVIAARREMEGRFPGAGVTPDPALEATIRLPDPADAHVLAGAVAAGAALLVTFNLRDFPRRTLAGLGLEARHPDGLLWELHGGAPAVMDRVIGEALDTLATGHGRAALKRAQLPRLGRAWEAGAGARPDTGAR